MAPVDVRRKAGLRRIHAQTPVLGQPCLRCHGLFGWGWLSPSSWA
jgi:hypothetical protein